MERSSSGVEGEDGMGVVYTGQVVTRSVTSLPVGGRQRGAV